MRVIIGFVLAFIIGQAEAQTPSQASSFERINSPLDELNPIISPDGNTLFLTIANHPSNAGGKRDPGDIWFCTRLGDGWSSPIHAGNEINDFSYNAVGAVSPDGNQLFLLSHYHANENRAKTQGIAIAQKTNNGWSRPKNITIPYYMNRSLLTSGCFNADQTVFVFSAETYGTTGVEDLYVSINDGGKWTEPRNLGTTINTSFQELTPSLSSDGKTLYFSTNGRKGFGSFDVFATTRLDESWRSWSPPVNLGAVVNSEGRELFYRDYAASGYYILTSTTSSDGYSDVKMHQYRNDQNIVSIDSVESLDSVQYTNATVETPDEKTGVSLKGVIVDAKTSVLVKGRIQIMSSIGLPEKNIIESPDGKYNVTLDRPDSYTIQVDAPGYVSVHQKVDARLREGETLEVNFKLQPIAIGTTVNLQNVLFEQGKADLLPESFDELNVVVSFLRENPRVKIELAGHTDSRGVHQDNVHLSQERVNSVKEYLVSEGIDSKRITGKGYGGTRPIASNDSEETRKMNRRVEFTIRKF
ncbi:MAG TPA: OmpA family protein [Chryseosolibacter sp.]|nr:OmpA family protein [Chryseosolibacter sp.]